MVTAFWLGGYLPGLYSYITTDPSYNGLGALALTAVPLAVSFWPSLP